jgi:5-methylcytosine-specific restriction endonuclease McrA
MRGWIAARGAVWAAPIVLEDEASEWNAKRAEQARISYRQYRSNRAAVIAAASDCAICRQPLTLADPAEADHIVPRSQGGQHSFENLRAVHRGCNLARGDKPV